MDDQLVTFTLTFPFCVFIIQFAKKKTRYWYNLSLAPRKYVSGNMFRKIYALRINIVSL